ncbi:protein spire isoform X3 [Phlebotomus papatasi]|uniref:protein spire isoform X3 n=1 Tax=Phlebotomus papatasi TaxID=29031 RepID=UPI002484605F|nr:protein spire isoform X3 [Phlebotomus papatasi]
MSKVKSASAEMASKSENSKNPSSKNLEDTPTPGPSHSHRSSDDVTASQSPHPLYSCSDPDGCVSLQDILKSFNASISEEQAWALIYRFVSAYRASVREPEESGDFKVPVSPRNYKLHRDGMVHVQFSGEDVRSCVVTSQKKVLQKIGYIVYKALDYNFSSDEECVISPELDQLINEMTYEDVDDEGIERDSDDAVDGEKFTETKEMDHVLDLCSKRVSPSFPNDHYKAVCRALATESIELRIFLQKVLQGEAEVLRIQADAETSQQELDKLGFNDWSDVRIWRALQARFWMQVVDELRRGVRLKKCSFSRTPVEYELTPYEILMEDIRSRKYNLRKVMVNGDIPQRVKKDAHAVILEFIRSRPPLKKASERKLPPLKAKPTPRDQLLDSIRKGRVLKPIPRHKSRLLNSCQMDNVKRGETPCDSQTTSSPRTSRQRLIPVDPALFQDEDLCYQPRDDDDGVVLRNAGGSSGSGRKGDDSTANNENNPNSVNTVLRRTTYDLATQCESRRASMRRHTIVGCHQGISECQSMPPSRPESRQSEHTSVTVVADNLTSMETWSKNSLDEKEWKEGQASISDRLSLTLKEIMHIRSVITKADLELLPVEVKIKEDVEKRKVCFLCLKTRFSIFGPWGVLCKLCQKTVCSKCYSKMRIPTEHFRNVPVMLLSPSLVSSPTASGAPSPSHYGHGSSGVDMESFPRSLMERLLRPESDRKTRNTVGSAPSSPKHQRSASSTPGSSIVADAVPSTLKDPISATRTSSIMSRSMEGPRSLPPQSPARPHSNSSTLDRRNRFTMLTAEQKEGLRGELMAVCNDCRGLVLEIIRSSRQTRSTARNIVLKNLTLDLSPVYKRW